MTVNLFNDFFHSIYKTNSQDHKKCSINLQQYNLKIYYKTVGKLKLITKLQSQCIVAISRVFLLNSQMKLNYLAENHLPIKDTKYV